MNTIRIPIGLAIILSIYFVQSCKENTNNTNKKINSFAYKEEIGDSFSITMPRDVYNKYLSRLKEIDTANRIDFSHINLQSDLKVHGKIKTYSEKEYSTFVRFGKIRKTGYVKSQAYFDFNKAGQKLEENCDFPDFHIVDQKHTYNYDNQGNLIEENWFEYGALRVIYKYHFNEKNLLIDRIVLNSEGAITFKNTYKYDDSSKLIELNNYSIKDDYLDRKTMYKYDNLDKLIEKSEYKSDGDLNQKQVFKYNDRGKLIEESDYNSEDTSSLSYRQTSIFDSKGNMVEKITIFQDNRSKTIKQYDNKGNLTLLTDYDNDSLQSKYSYKYDSDNRRIEKSLLFMQSGYRYLGASKINYKYNTSGKLIEEGWFNEENLLYQKFIYQFDENSNMLNATVYNSKGGILSKYVYTYGNYDLNHNWLLKTVIINDKGESIIERQIEYY